jgi:antitoxin HicB
MKIAYPARITKEEDGIFFVVFPDLEEAVTQGETLDEAEVNVQAALLIRKARAGKSLADLARILDASWLSVKRLENPRSSPTLKMINKAAAALGKRLVLSFE